MPDSYLETLVTAQNNHVARGITAVCSAHPTVLSAALDPIFTGDGPVLIEATCNQVNQDGGYTGMTPADFRDFVYGLAQQQGFETDRIILGGDHLGPNPWTSLGSAAAMDKACAMVADYARAGFTKIHLDASMSCADDPNPLPDEVIAHRAATLAAVAEENGIGQRLVYVIGTEVPVPGGATEHVDTLEPTSPQNAADTVALHQTAFAKAGIEAALERVIALVVQPGVEFGTSNVVDYDPARAKELVAARSEIGLLYEAHSTDYQTTEALRHLVQDGFGILKVGPWLTFALREALYALDRMADELGKPVALRAGMEKLMLQKPEYWQGHYHGSEAELAQQRHDSYSDRIRYYWTDPAAQGLVQKLMDSFGAEPLPASLATQYLPEAMQSLQKAGKPPTAQNLLRGNVQNVLKRYQHAVGAG